MAQNNLARQPEFQTQRPHLVFEEAFERLNQLEPHFLRQAADVVVALDHRRRVAADGHGLNHIGVKRALREKLRLARPPGRRLEHFDEGLADDLAFPLRVRHALEPSQEQPGCILVLQPDLEMAAEDFPHDFRLASAQQAVVDENAGKLTANGLVKQRRRDARIHAAAQTQDHLLIPTWARIAWTACST